VARQREKITATVKSHCRTTRFYRATRETALLPAS
jgi:hypothetical protein